MALSETSFLAAKTGSMSTMMSRNDSGVLRIIFCGHCTPVERIQEGRLLAPARLHFPARQHSDALQRCALGTDNDGLLSGSLHVDRSEHARELLLFLP